MSKRVLVGQVVKKSSTKTVSVLVKRVQRHPIYHKAVVKSKKYLAHDEGDALENGAWVRIQESRPLSKMKRWVVLETVSGESTATGDKL
ncbi:MAG: 30S ribosomal protein S17 [Alphaproteobacteria bacterium 40-19]|nr:MAG: 30S ribosomal protein S17 [Alphaproteobacteria bacterium 40-19]